MNKRLLISLFIGFLLVIGFFTAFNYIQNGPQSGNAPSALRYSFMWNEKVWSLLSSAKRMSVKKPKPPKGKTPRVNGMLGLESAVDLKNYLVEVESGPKNLKLPVGMFHLIPKSSYSTDFRCIEGWSEETHYAGARFSDFMKHYDLGRKSDGSYYQYVGLETPDGEYYVSIDMESMMHDQTVLAYEMNEAPLSLENGAPIRLIIPIKYGIKSLKRIGRIFFSDSRPPDYWAERGYDWYSGL
ncbi:molybdopterin-dependent oxidoreductase [Peredibacter sp. HCB2-198]|uniref:molybdopterin-dependent oxidoreductase n=1 Tax=Peredibacter sp. HCB2-198 TaxID=3383025 RepID=UPI0038B4A9D8